MWCLPMYTVYITSSSCEWITFVMLTLDCQHKWSNSFLMLYPWRKLIWYNPEMLYTAFCQSIRCHKKERENPWPNGIFFTHFRPFSFHVLSLSLFWAYHWKIWLISCIGSFCDKQFCSFHKVSKIIFSFSANTDD